jgi:hypothetical protein
MHRRSLLGLVLAMAPAAALAQQAPPPGGQQRARPKLAEMEWGQMSSRQRQRVAQALAGAGQPAMLPDQAQQTWTGMNQGQRRQAIRAYAQATGGGRQGGNRPNRAGQPADPSMAPPLAPAPSR